MLSSGIPFSSAYSAYHLKTTFEPPLLSYWVIQTGTFHRFHPAALAAEKQRSTDYYE